MSLIPLRHVVVRCHTPVVAIDGDSTEFLRSSSPWEVRGHHRVAEKVLAAKMKIAFLVDVQDMLSNDSLFELSTLYFDRHWSLELPAEGGILEVA